MKRLFFVLPVLVLVAYACNVLTVADYSQISVPQEAGRKFVEITNEDQVVWGPAVNISGTKATWYTGSMLDISPDGDKLVYIASTAANQREGNVEVKSTKGGRSSVQRTFGLSASNPCFSPDGNSIAFSGYFPGDNKSTICLINTNEGSSIKHLTEAQSGTANSPCFSSDGQKIFYTRGMASQQAPNMPVIWTYSIWSIETNTSITTQYTDGSSPNYVKGDKLLITKANQTTGQGEIWEIDLKSGQETLVLRDNKRSFSTPKISPDGKRILCTGTSVINNKANLDIFMLNIDGTGLEQLTFHYGNDVSPCWAPDGKSIYFLSQRGNPKGSWNIWNIEIN